MHIISTLKKLAAAALLTIFIVLLIMTCSSCRVSKNISTSKVNTDSLVTHVKDSMSEVHVRETSELKRMLQEMTTSGVTFVVDSCPKRDAVLALLDSAGRANYEKAILQEKIKSLTAKVKISSKGDIEAEGPIKAAYFTNSKLQEELRRTERTIDQLTVENDSLKTQLTKSVQTKEKIVEKRFIPWWIYLAMAGAAGLVWVVRGRLIKPKTI